MSPRLYYSWQCSCRISNDFDKTLSIIINQSTKMKNMNVFHDIGFCEVEAT